MWENMEAHMRSWKHFALIVVIILTILSLLLAACGPIENQNGSSNSGKDKGRDKDKNKDGGNGPDKDNGAGSNKVLICHRTGSTKKPYVQIRVADDALKDGHGAHAGDLIPAPSGGCPRTAPAQYP